ncbi:MAG TPA: dephospho-CoA kinase [Candidatus Acidoferrales bacterium]|jgi:dephospho-CoA kinase|nr:dephospho-CoA kinase [Candidatus Acidoferrales bacterium]
MLSVGLTGGIATGKTAVVAMLRELGCRVLEADKIAHQMIEPDGPAYEAVVREFGRGILTPEGLVDRQKLGPIVFADPRRLARLNAVVHPPVLAEQSRQLEAIGQADPHAIAVVEAALLIEAGFDKKLESIIVTWCTPEQQLERLTAPGTGRGLSVEQARQRIAAQMPVEEKRRRADEVIDCSGTLEHTRAQVIALFAKLKGMEGAKSREIRTGS